MKEKPEVISQPQVASEWLESERVRTAIEAEPELPDDMPEQMWAAVKDDRDAAIELLRIVVRLTKRGIAKRLGLEINYADSA